MDDLYQISRWPTIYDDGVFDEIVWSEIESSESPGDFICYFVHKLVNARHRDEARAKLETLSTEEKGTIPVGYTRAVARIRTMAESGDPEAMFHVGKFYALGISVEQNPAIAAEWYEKAMELGEMRAQCNLGWLYQSGFGVLYNPEKAFRLLSEGADSGIPVAKATIGLMLLSGEGCEADPELGIEKLKESFEMGYENAGNQLADAYFAGKLVPRDIELGHVWLQKVADSGDARIMAILGHYLVTGSHGKSEPERGITLLETALAQGYLPACLWLANLYISGSGVENDLAKAQACLEIGAQAGDKTCQKKLGLLTQTTDTLQSDSQITRH